MFILKLFLKKKNKIIFVPFLLGFLAPLLLKFLISI